MRQLGAAIFNGKKKLEKEVALSFWEHFLNNLINKQFIPSYEEFENKLFIYSSTFPNIKLEILSKSNLNENLDSLEIKIRSSFRKHRDKAVFFFLNGH